MSDVYVIDEQLRQLRAEQAKTEQAMKERDEARKDRDSSRKRVLLFEAVTSDGRCNDPGSVVSLIERNVVYDSRAERISGVEVALSNLESRSPHYFGKSEDTQKGQSTDLTEEDKVKHLFGSGSNALHANNLAQSNPTEYRRLRVIAARLGLVA